MNAASLYAYASAYWVDTLVEAFYSHLSALSWETCYLADSDKSLCDFRYFSFEETLKEERTGTGKYNLRIVVFIIHTSDDSLDGLAFAVLVLRRI